MTSEPLHLMVSVGLQDDASTEARDEAARLLRRELNDANVGVVEIARDGAAPPGTRSGEALLFGTLALSVLPGALALVLAISRDWASRSAGRTLTFSYGTGAQRLEFQYDPEKTDLNQLVAQIMRAPSAANALTLGAGTQVGGNVIGGDNTVTQTAGGDIVVRDKITHTHIHAEPGATIIVGGGPAEIPPASSPPEAG